MKVTKERNPYLKRIGSETPHKYSYEMSSGKYFLVSQDGTEREINKIGTFHSKFRKNFTGFVAPYQRYEEAKKDDTALHYTPDLSFVKENSYYTPATRKFLGYAQQPYQLRNRKGPMHLSNPDDPHLFRTIKEHKNLKKSNSEHKEKLKSEKKITSVILENAATTFVGGSTSDQYFQTSYAYMTDSKPLPKKIKKSCYNYRCKFLRHFVFDEKQKTEASTRFSKISSAHEETLSKGFYDRQFETQKKQNTAIKSVL